MMPMRQQDMQQWIAVAVATDATGWTRDGSSGLCGRARARRGRGLLWLILLVALAPAAASAEPSFPQAKPLAAAAANHLDVAYLPHRQAGAWQDRWVTLNVHVPPGDGPFPCIVFVHGGGYAKGDKDQNVNRDLLDRAVREGYVVANLNYILKGPAEMGITPQVWLDFKNAVRFLRANAEAYRIDPCRMAAWGFSAGGWLAGSGAFTTADDYHKMPPTDLETNWGERRQRGNHILVPFDDPRTPYPGQPARLSAIVADFWPKPHYRYFSADDPAILTYAGTDATHPLVKRAAEVGHVGDQIVLTEPRYEGKAILHIPPLDAAARPLDGGDRQSTLTDEAFAWLGKRLVTRPRLVPPEARPMRRQFAESVDVTLVACGEGVAVHYTTDGSPPTRQSPRYEGPFSLTGTTTVRAIAVRSGFDDSAVATFTFTEGDPPPTIAGPDRLPQATVGQPYQVRFTTGAGGGAVWNLSGHAQANVKMHTDIVEPPLGLSLDPQTGVLSGVPTLAGAWTLQVQAAAKPGSVADARDYILTIRPASNP